MFKKIISVVASAAVVAGVLLAAPAQAAGVQINGSGSSFANNAMQACAAAYSTNTVTYQSTGSGTGRSQFAAGTTKFGVSDAVYSSGFPSVDYTTVPLFGGPVAFAYTAAGVSDGLNLTAQNVSDIFRGVITRWDDSRLKANNPKIKLPKKAIKVLFRAGSSGTSENVANYLKQNLPGQGWTKSGTWATALGVTTPVGTGYPTSGDLATAIEDSLNAFTYFDLSDATNADVSVAKLQNAAGAFVAPTAAAAAKFLNSQSWVTNGTDATNGTVTIDFTKSVSGAYQLSILTYGLAPRFIPTASQKVSTDAGKLAVGDFFKYVVTSCIPAKAASLGYVPLGGALKTNALNQIKFIG